MEQAPFSVHLSQTILDDLFERLERVRWPDEAEDAGWAYGTNLAYMKELVEYWRTGFDWRAQERAINAFAQYRANVKGLQIHFIHERGKGPHPLPLILTHGWPSTFSEMLKILPKLTDPERYGGDPEDAFDVVVPSLPGYGFSEAISRYSKWSTHEVWAELMSGLGYEHFGAQGGDVGAGVTTNLGRYFPEQVIGIHLSSNLTWPFPPPPEGELSQAEKDYLARAQRWEEEEGAYEHQQSTRPQTLAYGLNDSPVGLAAWIVEKFYAWGDCAGDIERRFSKDELLTDVMLYWATQTISSSIRGYYESRQKRAKQHLYKRVEVPTGIAIFPNEVLVGLVPREWAERSYAVQHWKVMAAGGHFAAMEEPDLLVEDIREFFRGLRTSAVRDSAGQ